MSTAQLEPTAAAPRRQSGMARRYQPITASTASVAAASLRLFGDTQADLNNSSHRGEMLRYVLRSLYGADYQRRGAKLLGVSGKALSAMLCGGLRVSRAIVQRLEHAYPDRARHRRGELRSLAALIAAAFEAETHGLDRSQELIRLLARAASAAANTHNPHSRETGRFVRRVQVKAPVIAEPLRELAAAPVKKKRVPRR